MVPYNEYFVGTEISIEEIIVLIKTTAISGLVELFDQLFNLYDTMNPKVEDGYDLLRFRILRDASNIGLTNGHIEYVNNILLKHGLLDEIKDAEDYNGLLGDMFGYSKSIDDFEYLMKSYVEHVYNGYDYFIILSYSLNTAVVTNNTNLAYYLTERLTKDIASDPAYNEYVHEYILENMGDYFHSGSLKLINKIFNMLGMTIQDYVNEHGYVPLNKMNLKIVRYLFENTDILSNFKLDLNTFDTWDVELVRYLIETFNTKGIKCVDIKNGVMNISRETRSWGNSSFITGLILDNPERHGTFKLPVKFNASLIGLLELKSRLKLKQDFDMNDKLDLYKYMLMMQTLVRRIV